MKKKENANQYWMCIIGPTVEKKLQAGSDEPMRKAVQDAFHKVTGHGAKDIWSRWGMDEKKKEAVLEEWNRKEIKDNLYGEVIERLWEKLEYYRDTIDISYADFKKPFPIDQLISGNPIVKELIDEVQREFKYVMSEFQCSNAVNQFIKGGIKMMKKYNKKNGTDLKPKA